MRDQSKTNSSRKGYHVKDSKQTSPPYWFSLSNYEVLDRLTLAQWPMVLRGVQMNRVRLPKRPEDFEGWLASNPQGSASYMGEVIESWQVTPEVPRNWNRLERSGLPLAEVAVADLDRWRPGRKSVRVLAVDLRCPDTVLQELFDAWLKERRKSHPMALAKRGPKGQKVRFTADHARTWRDHRIVELADLEFYASCYGLRYRNDDLGRWLFQGQQISNLEQRVSEARKVLKVALGNLDALEAQAAGEAYEQLYEG